MKKKTVLLLSIFSFSLSWATPSFVVSGNDVMASAGFPSQVSLGQGDWEYLSKSRTISVPDGVKNNDLSKALYLHEKGHAYLLQNEKSLPAAIQDGVAACSSKMLVSRYGDGVAELFPDIVVLAVGDSKTKNALLKYRHSEDGASRRPVAVRSLRIANEYLLKNKNGYVADRVGKALSYACSVLPSRREADLSALKASLSEVSKKYSGQDMEMSYPSVPYRWTPSFGEKTPLAYLTAYAACVNSGVSVSMLARSKNACSLSGKEFEGAFCSVFAAHVSRDAAREETGDFAMSVAPKTDDGRTIAASAISNSVPLVLFNDVDEFSAAVDSVCTTDIKDRETLPREIEAPSWASEVPDYGGFVSKPAR